jgi:hypothetical protein
MTLRRGEHRPWLLWIRVVLLAAKIATGLPP